MKQIEVVAAVIMKKQTVLAAKRNYGEFQGMWEFPGGKIEPGETHKQALIREIREELQVEIQVESFIDTVEYDYPSFHLTMHCYQCRLKEGESLVLSVHDALRWLEAEQLFDVPWLPADQPIVKQLKDQKVG